MWRVIMAFVQRVYLVIVDFSTIEDIHRQAELRIEKLDRVIRNARADAAAQRDRESQQRIIHTVHGQPVIDDL